MQKTEKYAPDVAAPCSDRQIEKPGASLDSLHALEMEHYTRYGTPLSRTLSDRIILDAFEAYIRGDKSVDQYILFRYVSREIDRGNKKFLGRPLQWEATCLDRWHRQFQYGAALEPLSDHDTRQRVLLLLTSDLFPFEARNEARFKATLLKNYSHLLDSQSFPSPQAFNPDP